MNHGERVFFFRTQLKRWYRTHGRKFPWRKKETKCYENVISEILLKRTKAETVSSYYPTFIKRFPSWKSLTLVTQEELEEFLKPIGLFRQRALSLVNLSKELEVLGFVLPRTKDKLMALTGIGQYVANAVLMFCFGEKKPLLDTNMARLLERFFGQRNLSDIRYDPYLQALSHDVVSTDNPKEMNWAILDLASLICRKEPACDECPLHDICYYKNNYSDWKKKHCLEA